MHALIVFMTISVMVLMVYIYSVLTFVMMIHARIIINDAVTAPADSQIIHHNDYGPNVTYMSHVIGALDYAYDINSPAATLIKNNNTRKYI